MFSRKSVTATRSALQFFRQPSMIKIVAAANQGFSKFNSIESGSGKLVRALEKEVKYEQDNYTQLEDIEQFLNESGFAFTEHEDSIKMNLKKTVGDKLVEIRFESR